MAWLLTILGIILATAVLFVLFCAILILCHAYNPMTLEVPEGTVKIACAGDSTTFGAMMRKRQKNCYPQQLQSKLGDGYHVLNFGMSGKTAQKSGDEPVWEHRYFKQVQEYSPDVVFLMLGANDAKAQNYKGTEAFLKDLDEMIHIFKKLPASPRMILMTPCAAPKSNYKIQPANVAEIRDAVKAYASEKQMECIDMYAVTDNHPDWYVDGIHPNSVGAKAMTETVFAYFVKK